MNDFQTIIPKLKALLSQTQPTRVHDKDVAAALGLSPSTFASMKRRNTTPYRALLDFCAERRINANRLLFQRPANNLIKVPATIRYYEQVGAGAGGGANVLDEGFREMTLRDLLALFLSRLDEGRSC